MNSREMTFAVCAHTHKSERDKLSDFIIRVHILTVYTVAQNSIDARGNTLRA
jgi:hypothetical protein